MTPAGPQDRTARTLEVAEEIAREAAELGVATAVIGAVALAVHGYPRSTEDLDLATDADPFTTLAELRRRLEARGYAVELVLPDAEDPLGGVLTATGADFDPVQVVNYLNPLAAAANPGAEAIAAAEPGLGSAHLKVVTLAHLVALKLFAGGPKSRNDVIELLTRNPGADRGSIREVCRRHGLEADLTRILEEIEP